MKISNCFDVVALIPGAQALAGENAQPPQVVNALNTLLRCAGVHAHTHSGALAEQAL